MISSWENLYDWDLGQINDAAKKKPKEFIGYAEAFYSRGVGDAVSFILERKNSCKVILLAGPSSSGKTTTASMIRDRLIKHGHWSTIISLDDFYKGLNNVPLLEDGSKDFESINSLNTEAIEECIFSLIKNGYCDIPTYNFETMAPNKEKKRIIMPKNGIAIIEGLHALNPVISKNLPLDRIIKMYVSVAQGIDTKHKLLITPREIRLCRRVIRDYNYRYTLPERTLIMWDNVCKGENKYIEPYKNTSDFTINSLHMYEMCVLAQKAKELLKSVPKDIKLEEESSHLPEVLSQFYPINPGLVPSDSLLKEFI